MYYFQGFYSLHPAAYDQLPATCNQTDLRPDHAAPRTGLVLTIHGPGQVLTNPGPDRCSQRRVGQGLLSSLKFLCQTLEEGQRPWNIQVSMGICYVFKFQRQIAVKFLPIQVLNLFQKAYGIKIARASLH